MSVWAVLAAAGSGERLGLDRPKAFANLRDRPLLAETLERLEDCDWIDSIVVAVPRGWEEPAILLAEELGAGKVVACVTGGATRAESVRAAVAEVPDDAAVIVVHDAARPLVSDEMSSACSSRSARAWTARSRRCPSPTRSSACRAARSSRRSTAEISSRCRPRRRSSPTRCAGAGGGRRREATDCSSLVEAAGGRVAVVEGDHRLLKVTEPADLELVEALLSGE